MKDWEGREGKGKEWNRRLGREGRRIGKGGKEDWEGREGGRGTEGRGKES